MTTGQVNDVLIAVVTRDVAAGATVVGNPVRIMEKGLHVD